MLALRDSAGPMGRVTGTESEECAGNWRNLGGLHGGFFLVSFVLGDEDLPLGFMTCSRGEG